ncbi:MAG: hypothetical protein ACHQF2_09620 [Flavobacteriales bacterium]
MRVLKFLAWSNWIISLGAALLASTTWIRFGLPVKYDVLLFIFLSTLLVYTFQRILKFLYIKQHPELYNWCVKHYKFLIVQCVLALLALIPLINYLPVIVLYALLTSAVFSLLYLFVSPFSLKISGLRHLPFLKSILISVVWAIVTAIVPLLCFGNVAISQADISWVYIEHMLFIYALTIPFDVRDMQLDSEKMKTLPQVAGEKNARIIGSVLLLTFLLVTELLNAPRPLPVLFVYGVTAMLLLYPAKNKSFWFYLYLIDGMIYLYAFLFWLIYWFLG